MPGIGNELKSGRDYLGLSIAQLSQQTGIPPHLLEALETERFHELPDAVYLRGFIRRYAVVVSLDAGALIDLLPDEYRVPGAQTAPPAPPRPAAAAIASPEPPVAPKPLPVPPAAIAAPPPPAPPVQATTQVPRPPLAASARPTDPIQASAPAPAAEPAPIVPAAPVSQPVAPASLDAPKSEPVTVQIPPSTVPVAKAPSGEPASAPKEAELVTAASVVIIGETPPPSVIVDEGVLEPLAESPGSRRGGLLPSWLALRPGVPFAGGVVALGCASLWLVSVLSGGGDGDPNVIAASSGTQSARLEAISINGTSTARANSTKQAQTPAKASATATRERETNTPKATSTTAPPTPTATATPSPTPPPPTPTPVTPIPEPTVEQQVSSVPVAPAVPENPFALCSSLGNENYSCGQSPWRVICTPAGPFYDPNGIVPSPIPVEWAGWRETTVSGRLELIRSVC